MLLIAPTASSNQKARENPSAQRRNKPESESTPLRTSRFKASRHFTSLLSRQPRRATPISQIQAWLSEATESQGSGKVHGKVRILKYPTSVTGIYCKNMTTTSSTAIDGVLRHLIAESEISKFKIRQTLYKANSPNASFIKQIRQILIPPDFLSIR